MTTNCQYKHFGYYGSFYFALSRILIGIISACDLISFIFLSYLFFLKYKIGKSQNGILGQSSMFISFIISSSALYIYSKPIKIIVYCLKQPIKKDLYIDIERLEEENNIFYICNNTISLFRLNFLGY